MRRIDILCCLQLEKNHTIDDKISFIVTDNRTAKPDRGRDLSINMKASAFQCPRKSFFINSLKKSVSEFVVNLVENSDDLVT